MSEETKKYYLEYDQFLKEYAKGMTDGERVGITIARFAQYFAMANSEHADALFAFDKVAALVEQSDDANGKPLSSAKAKVLASATPEADKLNITKARVANIEQMINALKSLQRGVMQEMGHMNNS